MFFDDGTELTKKCFVAGYWVALLVEALFPLLALLLLSNDKEWSYKKLPFACYIFSIIYSNLDCLHSF